MKISTTIAMLLVAASFSLRAELIGLYTFDDPDMPLADQSGAGNTLESAGSDPVYLESGGIEGGAYEFDGSQRLVAPIDINPAAMPEATLGA